MDRRSRSVEKEVAWVVEHPDRARAWSQRGRISALAMGTTLGLGLIVHLLGFALGTAAIALPAWVPTELASTLVSNLGIVLWTSVVLVVCLEVLPRRTRLRATRSMAIAADRLRAEGRDVPRELEDLGDDEIGHEPTLDKILERLDSIERLLAERADRAARDTRSVGIPRS